MVFEKICLKSSKNSVLKENNGIFGVFEVGVGV